MEANTPEIFVLAGPNGAGKSTVAGHLLPEELDVEHFINADLIAKGLSPHAPEASAFLAGRTMLHRIHELREQRQTFAFETTLASKTFARFLRESQRRGYVIHIIYVVLRNAELAINRVCQRVSRGGHHIPEEIVRRRFRRSIQNFFQLYSPLAEGWAVWDNSERMPTLVARGSASEPRTITGHELWEQLSKQGMSDER